MRSGVHQGPPRQLEERQARRLADQYLATYAGPLIGDIPVAAVDTDLVVKARMPIWEAKTGTATRLRGRIESVLDWATVSKFRTGDNPARWRGAIGSRFPRFFERDQLPVGFIPLAYREGVVFGQHRSNPDQPVRQAAGRLAAREGIERFPVQIRHFQQRGQGGVQRSGDGFHDLERRVGFAVRQVRQERQERQGHSGRVGKLVLCHATFVEQAQDVGKKYLVIHRKSSFALSKNKI